MTDVTPQPSDTRDAPHPSSGARVLAVANQKGGVGKTTTVASLGAALAQRGRHVLLVDLDPQASLTFSLGIDPEELDVSVREVLLGEKEASDAIVVTDEAVHLLPSTIELAEAEETLATRTGREQRLRVALEPVAGDYDWIIIDCPPSLGVLTAAALTAASDLLIPLQCETLAHRGVGQLLDTVHDVRTFTNPRLRILGVLPTVYDGRTKHARAVLEAITSSYGLAVVEPAIPRTVRFAEAPAYGQSILRTAASHRGAQAYRDVADTLLAS